MRPKEQKAKDIYLKNGEMFTKFMLILIEHDNLIDTVNLRTLL